MKTQYKSKLKNEEKRNQISKEKRKEENIDHTISVEEDIHLKDVAHYLEGMTIVGTTTEGELMIEEEEVVIAEDLIRLTRVHLPHHTPVHLIRLLRLEETVPNQAPRLPYLHVAQND